MTKAIIITVIIGVVSGYLFVPDIIVEYSGTLITFGLCLLLFFVGMDIGRQGSVFREIKRIGFRILLVPIAVMVGSLAGGAVAGLLLPMTVQDTLAVSAGFGWYSLAPIILTDYSATVSAVSFLHNVMREVFGMVLIPIVAQYIGYLETVSLPGAASMDTCLPIVERATNSNVAIYSFVTGVIISIVVPILVPFIISF
ncbi:MAG: lysine exporter LysO family protein [Anaerovoracaceae bacterium]|jgi:uncharacterized membrane protein YbjE (DUF340 family)